MNGERQFEAFPGDQAETFGSQPEAWSRLSAETRAAALAVRGAMAERFQLEPDDFELCRAPETAWRSVWAVVYAGDNGVDFGAAGAEHDVRRSWESIFSEQRDDEFKLETAGHVYDSRGLTRSLYVEMMRLARRQRQPFGEPMPDSETLSRLNGRPRTDTWLTDEPTHQRREQWVAQVADWDDAYRRVSFWTRPTTADEPTVAFRPAAVIIYSSHRHLQSV